MGVLQDELCSHFLATKKGKGDFYKNCLHSLSKDLDTIFAQRIRLNELSSIYSLIWPSTIFSNGNMPLLDDLFGRNFETGNGQITINPERIQDFANLSSRLDPAVVVGWGLAKNLSQQTMTLDDILNTALSSHERMYLPLSSDHKVLAENHVHLGGAYGIDLSFFSGIFSPNFSREISSGFESLRRWLIELFGSIDPTNKSESENILKKEFSGRWRSDTPSLPDWSGWAKRAVTGGHAVSFSKIRRAIAIAWNQEDVDRAWLGMWVWLWLCYMRTTSRHIRIAIMLAVITMMNERSKLIMQGGGLARFIKNFHKASRKHGTPAFQERMSVRRIFANERDVAEIKVSFHNIENLIPQLTEAISRFQLENQNMGRLATVSEQAASLSQAVNRWHCCVHFFRIRDYAENPALILDEAREIGRKLSCRPQWNLPDELLQMDMPWLNSRLGDWIRGIDVAGDENLIKIECFSPALRMLREIFFKRDESGREYYPIHFSLHAGEDFADILSGLRHIDESVQFCNMTRGDRLGHALALGIDPLEWANGKKSTVLDLDEHVDNLVWLWKSTAEMKIVDFDDVKSLIEERTMLLFRKLPWMIGFSGEAAEQWTIEDLSQEWALRRNSFDHWIRISKSGSINPMEDHVLVPDEDVLNQENRRASSLFSMRGRWLRDRYLKEQKDSRSASVAMMPKVYVRFADERETLSCRVQFNDRINDLIEDVCHSRQLELLHILQDSLYRKYAAAGLQIETNPTSNVYIGEFDGYSRHPIFRWEKRNPNNTESHQETIANGTNAMKVTVNTDDPGVMPTNLRLEFALLKEAACLSGLSSEEAQRWISELESSGLNEFQEKHKGMRTFVPTEAAGALLGRH
ncbi:hypothetical protein J2X56_003114 [Herbaspirillum sp. 1173]|uniref:hypothetical protein n=1 Tax=Herbaspirillum sp. 1173 TaxID=2817734 RepID=UPI002866B210|nr:hypothetical protein [Herbaspirillum sp. 1173]MDR6741090.1 hypothetical protein [Herbaspirillum sp. 1173]